MRLLVSVRDPEEAGAALAGGADIVDAKEPALGPLAPVSGAALQAICAAVPLTVPLSVALGDAHPLDLTDVVSAVGPLQRRSGLFFKAAIVSGSPQEAEEGIRAACRRLEQRVDRPVLVVARYVDGPSGAADLMRWVEVCAVAGAGGLLLDTCRKDGPGLFGSVGIRALAALRRHAARHGTWLAVAGSVAIGDLGWLARVRPHIVGVRGAVCDGGRTGKLSLERVRQLQQALASISLRARPPALPV
jgi:uncharacterized protein (UPF0264 family)